MMRLLQLFVAATLLALGGGTAAASTLQSCLTLEDPARRAACVHEVELPPLPDSPDIPAGGDRISDAVWIEALDARFDSAVEKNDAENAARAMWQLASIAADSGQLQRIDPNGAVSWTSTIDAGSGHWGKAATWLQRAGRSDLAGAALGRAMALGQAIEPGDDWDAAALKKWTPVTDPILAGTWHLPLDPVNLALIDGTSVHTGDLLGNVLVFDFWASWCGPCREELPLMQAFHRENAERGLHTYAVNVDEPRDIARSSARSLGLQLPIVAYTPELRDAFDVKRLPTVVLADRNGKIRGRWDLFKEGTEEEIFSAIREILDAKDAEPEAIAESLSPKIPIEVHWMREFRAPIEGIAMVPGPEGQSRPVVAYGRSAHRLEPDGRVELDIASGLTAGRLVAALPEERGSSILLSYRLGGTSVSRLDLGQGSVETWEAPAPILDLAWIDPADPAGGAITSTLEGVVQLARDGSAVRTSDTGVSRGLMRESDGTEAGWMVLTSEADGSLSRVRLDHELEIVDRQPTDAQAWRLEGGDLLPGGYLFPTTVRSTAEGRFVPESGIQVAVAGEHGLVLLDAASGAEVYRAHWPELSHVAAGDLDGDGRDELLLAWGRRVVLLTLGSSR